MKKLFSYFIIISTFLFGCVEKKEEVKSISNDFPKSEIETPTQQSSYCFIHDIRNENSKYLLGANKVDYKNDPDLNFKKLIEMPNGYYFCNENKNSETFNIDSSSAIIMQTFSFNEEGNFKFNQKVNISELIIALNEKPISRFKQIPFRLVSTGTKVDSLIEIYIP